MRVRVLRLITIIFSRILTSILAKLIGNASAVVYFVFAYIYFVPTILLLKNAAWRVKIIKKKFCCIKN